MLSWTNGTSLNFLGKRTESFELLSCVCLGRKVGLAQNPFYHTTVHVSECSSVANHCSGHALSDSKDCQLRYHCSHDDSLKCAQCESLSDVLCCMERYLAESKIEPELLEDSLYTHSQAVQAIQAWKAHQLRCVRQDKVRKVCLSSLNATTVLVTQDWAMKFLPVKYREAQSDWYGKQGLSWHASVVARKMNGRFESQSFFPHLREYVTRHLCCSAHQCTYLKVTKRGDSHN